MTIDWKNAPEGATHYIHVQSDLIFFKIKSDAVFCFSKSGGWKRSVVTAAEALRDPDYVAIPRPTPTAIPEPKKLTQAVFDGLPKEYLWAAVDGYNGAACAYILEPSVMDGDDQFSVAGGDYLFVGDGYDTTDWQNSKIERLSDTCIDDMGISNLQKKYQREDVPTIFEMDWAEQNQTLEAELSTLRTQAIADAARIAELEASLAARGEALEFMKGAQQEWYEMYMQKRDAISRFKAGLVRAGARVPIDAMTMNANEQGLTAALVYLESELDRAAKRKYDLASIVSRGEQDDEN